MPFVHDPQPFRSILGASEALIYGDFATEFFSRTTSKTLAIMAKATKADPVQAYLQTQGYLLVGEERVRLGSVTRLRRGELFIILRKTRLIPIQAILSRTPTTQAMNFIAWNKAYSVFPKTTFLDHEVLPLKGADKDVRAEIARNYAGAIDELETPGPGKWTWTHYAPPSQEHRLRFWNIPVSASNNQRFRSRRRGTSWKRV
ncbi:hypothetical protein PG999_004399 [Apiospora kogelbergensis]|uniref:Uncharacterized protein n=1 Tax=Apiospora kogelbergensis TaxID=1337665 RepID=A0AAW0QZA8_9PEZI